MMESTEAVSDKNVSAADKETQIVSSDHLRDVESVTASTSNRADSIYTIVGSALANLSDGYQQILASSTNVIFNHLLGKKIYTSAVQTRISNSLLVGSVIGIVVLGYTADKFSRKGGMFFTSALVVIGSLLATRAFQVKDSHNMLWFLTIARGIAGVGVGGEYPTSSAAALEGSNEHFDNIRGPIQVLISTLMATSGGPLCTIGYLASLIASSNNLEVAYHAMYSISIILPLFVIVFR